MRRAALIATLVACSGPAPAPPATPVENRAPPPAAAVDACNRDLSWLPQARYLRYTRIAHGHFGEWRFHADLYRLDGADTFEGVATGAFRHHARTPIMSDGQAVSLTVVDATALLTKLLDGIRTPPLPDQDIVLVTDSSQSIVISIEVMAFDPRVGMHPNFYVQFFTDHGETDPQAWNVRGCSYRQPLESRRAVQQLTTDLAIRLGHHKMFRLLQASAPPP